MAIGFSVQAGPRDGASWLELARRAEALGLASLLVADHPGVTASPFVALAAAAAVTSRIELGTNVVNAGAWEPLALARDVATLDVVSGGRAVLGVGAGHTPAEWTMVGRPYPSARERVQRMIELTDATRRLLAGETVTVAGSHVALQEARLEAPRPLREPVPLAVGGNGRTVLRYAARHADVVGLSGLGRTLEDGHHHAAEWRPAQIEERIALVHQTAEAAGRRPELEALVQHVELTHDPEAAAASWGDDLPDTTVSDLLAAPYVLIGTPASIAGELRGHERRLGITRYVVRAAALDALEQILPLLD